ncbi:MAG: alpha/beta hydrolase [Bacteroidales bacterium]|nr:alpha/beta hydrolase [Bacteroidales bacterium]MBN2818796.1 alpha/beta hydrolase [Bacteroidales bacterium]
MRKITLLAVAGIFTFNCFSQKTTINLWPDGEIPGAIDNNDYVEFSKNDNGWFRIGKVSVPTLDIYLPQNADSATMGILICPGGGYGRLAMDHEGEDVALWLNELGIAAFVLKYRLPSDEIMEDKKIAPLQDTQRAMRIIRENVRDYNVLPDKIGVMGFSAGGHLAATLTTQYDKKVYDNREDISARPDFSMLIYPVISMYDSLTHMGSRDALLGTNPDRELIFEYSNEQHVDSKTPPCFLVHSSDDNVVNPLNCIYMYEALLENKISVEMHIFEYGGHGYGMGEHRGGPAQWLDNLALWLKRQ